MKQEVTLNQITKRDGRVVPFDRQKIVDAIFKAAESVDGNDKALAETLADKVMDQLPKQVGVDKVQDIIEKTLIDEGHAKTAKAFILYHYKKNERKRRSALILGKIGGEENLKFSHQALTILERRYLLKDKLGNVLETPKQMLQRVATNISLADKLYGHGKNEVELTSKKFYEIMASLRFLPNSPTLINAGTTTQQLSSCVVLPIEDTMESIFGTLKDAAVIHQRGSGTGFSFSRLRPQGDIVGEHIGVAAGPVRFMSVYDKALEVVRQGGVRPGANMAVLRVDHPDIIRFIEAKRNKRGLKNFNISVGVTDRFMKAVEEDKQYYLVSPRTGKYVGKLRARDVFAVITQNAWKTGDPGLVFIDEINRKHPAKHLGEIETTNQCGEAPLLPCEGCVLGSINLHKHTKNNEMDWDLLRDTVETAVHFLDNVIDMNKYPTRTITEATMRTRKFGLGIMGLAELFCTLQIKYDSEGGLDMANKIMAFISDVTYAASERLAHQRGCPPAWKDSTHDLAGRKMRNITCLSISPTGTISILANTSSGCEPLFAISYNKTVLGDTQLMHVNPEFEKVAKQRGFFTPELMRQVARFGSIQQLKEIPKDVREIFVTSQDIKPEAHIRMQATLQKHVDNSISKTINFPRNASITDVENAYVLAWKAKCKGITIYRDGSYEEQVMNIGD